MNDYPMTRVGPSYAGAVVPYQQHAVSTWEPSPAPVDVYTSSAPQVAYRYAEDRDNLRVQSDLADTLEYYAQHQFWGWAVFLTKSTVSDRFRDLLRTVVFGDVVFAPEAIFGALKIDGSRQVKTGKQHWQNIIIDRSRDDLDHQRRSQMEIEALRIFIKCVDDVTREQEDNPLACAVCTYADYLVDTALAVLLHSSASWSKKMVPRFEQMRQSLTATIENNAEAYQEYY